MDESFFAARRRGEALSRTSLAVDVADDIADGAPHGIVSVRLFEGHVHRLAFLALAEATIIVCAVYAAILTRFPGDAGLKVFEAANGPIWPRAALVAGIVLVCLVALGLYQLRHRARLVGVLGRLLVALALGGTALALVFYLVPEVHLGRGVTFLTGTFAFCGLALTRFSFLRIVDEEIFKRRIVVWGAGQRAAIIGRRLRRRTDQRGFRIVSYLRAPGDTDGVAQAQPAPAPGELVRFVLRNKIEEVVVAMDDRRCGFPSADLLACRLLGVHVTDLPAFVERESGRISLELAHPSCLIFSSGFRRNMLRLATKRLFDVMVSAGLLVATLPLWILTAAAIWLEDRGPIFYRQIRVGQNGRHFTIYKFRSMRVGAEGNGQAVWAAADDARVTRVGGVIRRLRIDELPQAFNVLIGDMSFVGPRPERPAFFNALTRAIPFYAQRHFVKPGVTGWAQVRYSYGASEKDAREKLEYDLYYVKHHNLAFDFMVLLQTVEIVLFRIGSR